MINLTLPDAFAVLPFIQEQSAMDFTYAPLEGTRSNQPVQGYDNDYQKVKIGHGRDAFEAARRKIAGWAMFPAGWTMILPPKTPIKTGETVVMYARFMGLWWRNSCKIVYTINEQDHYGFAYGTLPGHVERGEELFLVEMDAAGDVWYTIKAFSKPRFWMAKVGYPVMRILQARFRKHSAAAMQE